MQPEPTSEQPTRRRFLRWLGVGTAAATAATVLPPAIGTGSTEAVQDPDWYDRLVEQHRGQVS